VTTGDLLGIMRRRWYVVLGGLLVTLVLANLVVSRPGVYTTRVDVMLLPTASVETEAGGSTLVSSSEDLIAIAGLVERLVNAHREGSAATSQDVTLVGTGIRNGTLIKLPNSGGQWDYNFTSPMLSVQVAAPTAAEVLQRRTDAIADINRTLRELQLKEGAEPDEMMTTQVVARDAAVVYEIGHPKRAAVGVLAIGAALTVALAVALDHLLNRRHRRRRSRDRVTPTAASV
jgi:hypothetical protein